MNLGKTYHFALSVDVDRFPDAKLKRDYAPFVKHFGGVNELREACKEARAHGLICFPPCDNTGTDGSCMGHPS